MKKFIKIYFIQIKQKFKQLNVDIIFYFLSVTFYTSKLFRRKILNC